MTDDISVNGPVLRLFEFKVGNGQVAALPQKFSTTSADVVRNEPDNRDFFFGEGMFNDAGRLDAMVLPKLSYPGLRVLAEVSRQPNATDH